MLFEAGISHLFHILFRHHPTDRSHPRKKILQKVGEGFFEVNAEPDKDLRLPPSPSCVNEFRLSSLVSPETEDHILGGHGVPVVKLHPSAQLKLVDLASGLTVHDSARQGV